MRLRRSWPGGCGRRCGRRTAKTPFILACAWLALAGLAAGETGGGRFTAGEVTIQEGDGAARAAALRLQAETVLGPWLADRGFAFQGVPG